MKNNFDFASFDWDGYLQHRPRYPPALYRLIYAYHAEHSTHWASAYDVGAGVGVVAAELLTRFTHVTASDPAPEYVERARAYLAAYAPPERLAFAVHGGEAPFAAAAPGTVDLVTVATAIHWTEPAAVLARAHEALRAGGTLAVWAYRPGFAVEGQPAVQAAWAAVFARWRREMVPRLASMGPLRIGRSNHDCIAFEEGMWADVRRLQWIAEYDMDTDIEPFPSKVALGEVMEVRDERDWFAVDADFAWIQGYVKSLQGDIVPEVEIKDELAALEAAMAEAGGRVRVSFPASLQLATKR